MFVARREELYDACEDVALEVNLAGRRGEAGLYISQVGEDLDRDRRRSPGHSRCFLFVTLSFERRIVLTPTSFAG